MGQNRWHANKLGLINFWYYDEQEFCFAKGRLLLRGSNGSGKSVTMQSAIPLLLDGNANPERLDPFGSRDRKMSGYLLEEGDEREERTGYLYMEFKREKCESYFTIGMGIRARRGKPLDKWYFGILDGRRVGVDFSLYRSGAEKLTLTRKELENRLAEGGRVYDRQADYIEFVNQQLFGFATTDAYREMLDLLIQLRTPKLSRDFKPSVINDILSSALQGLSEEDLRPMTEAIENMDSLRLQLETKEVARKAVDHIARVFDRYNRSMLYAKASAADQAGKRLKANIQALAEEQTKLSEAASRLTALTDELAQLSSQKATMEMEREELGKSDAYQLKQEEQKLVGQLAGLQENRTKKEARIGKKQDDERACRAQLQQLDEKKATKRAEIQDCLEDMSAQAECMNYQAQSFLEDELTKGIDEAFSFKTYEAEFQKTKQGIQEGLVVQQRLAKGEEKLREKRDELARQQDSADRAERKLREAEAALTEAESSWKEALYIWHGENQELKLPEEVLQGLCRFADSYDEGADYAQAKRPVDRALQDLGLQLKEELEARRRESRALSEEKANCEAELREWENEREPEPERSEAVLENRRRLTKRGIPYHAFYKTLEFADSLDDETRNRIEEAMLEMGLLDALVIEESYREEVLRLDPGACDRYIFVRKNAGKTLGKTALDALTLNDSVNTVFLNMEMTDILGHISMEGNAETVISADGTWRNGLLAGTISGEYHAGFIGTQARERNRAEKIRVLKERIAELEAEITRLSEEMAQFQNRIEHLEEEYRGFPKEKALKDALNVCEEAEKWLELQNKQKQKLDQEVHALIQALQEDRTEAAKIAERLYLRNSLEVFVQASQAAMEYQSGLRALALTHASYLDQVAALRQQQAQLDGIEADLEQLRYDQGILEKDIRDVENRRASIEKQLALTDYAAIQERLDTCIEWLAHYDETRGNCENERGRKETECRNTKEKIETLSAARILLEAEQAYTEEVYLEEYKLGYVFSVEAAAEAEDTEENTTVADGKRAEGHRTAASDGEDAHNTAADLAGAEEKKTKVYVKSAQETVAELRKSAEDLESLKTKVQQVYFECNGYLIDYQISSFEQFAELRKKRPQESSLATPVQRLDYQARYRGSRIPFQKLSGILDEELESLRQLIKQTDRELFEDILSNTMSRKIRSRINSAQSWVENMNRQMECMNTSSGLKLRLRWRSKTAESESQLDTAELVELLRKDYRSMKEEEATRLSQHFRSKVEESRRIAEDSGGSASFYQVMQEALDYRKWFEFQLFCEKPGERQKELTNSVFGTFSGGEKAMSMYVPLFSAVTAKYRGARPDAPQIVSLDEAFAGVDNRNIRDMFRLMREFGFDFIINSQVLWGDADTLDALAIYELVRPNNAKFVTALSFLWNGNVRVLMEDAEEMEEESRRLEE